MIDTSATLSTLPADALPTSNQSQTVGGIEGKPSTHYFSKPQEVRIGPLTAKHYFLLIDSPVNIIGRHLLCKL